jgi:hypothetical protein
MNAEFDTATVGRTLRQHGVRPDDTVAIFISGSLARGWGNQTSDLDVLVISREPYEGTGGERSHVVLQPDTLGSEKIYADGRRWDIQYWSRDQVKQLLDKVSWESYEDPTMPWATVSTDEIGMLERLPYAVVVEGDDWLEDVRRQLAKSAHRPVLVGMSLRLAGNFVEDAAGQLESGDVHSAVLATRLAFGHTVDAVQASLGQFGSNWPKWRARRMALVNSPDLAFEQYWEVETMETFRREDPAAWINSTLVLCRQLASELEL